MKKALQIVAVFLCLLVLLAGIVVAVLHHPRVQTYIVGQVTERLEQLTHSTMHVGRFHYRPLNAVTLDSVFVADQQGDTLLSIDRVHVYLSPLMLLNRRIDIREVQLRSPYINLYHTADSVLNMQFLLDAFRTAPDSTPFPFRVSVDRLSLIDTRFRFDDFIVYPVSLDMSVPVLSADSMDFSIRSLSINAAMTSLDASLSTTIHGNLHTLWADDIRLVYAGQPLFMGNVMVVHPTQLDSLDVSVSCQDLTCNSHLICDALSRLEHQPVALPPVLHRLGNVRYRGDMQGGLNGLFLHGAFTTAVGSLSVDGLAQSDTSFTDLSFHGQVATSHLELGRLLESNDLGVIAMCFDGQADLHPKDSIQPLSCQGQVHINTLQFRDYTYSDIDLSGSYDADGVFGSASVRDSMLSLDMHGQVDPDPNNMQMNLMLKLHTFCPNALHLIEGLPDMQLGVSTYVSLFTHGHQTELLDNLSGYVIMDTLTVQNKEHSVCMNQFKLLIDNDDAGSIPKEHYHNLRIQSDFVNMGCKGSFRYATLPQTIAHFLHRYVPSLAPDSLFGHREPNNLTFYAYFRDLSEWTQLFDMTINLPLYPTLKGYVQESDMLCGVDVFVPEVTLPMSNMENITLRADNNNQSFNVLLHGVHHTPKNLPITMHVGDMDYSVNLLAAQDAVDLGIVLENSDTVHNEGSVHIHTDLKQNASQPQADVHILPTELVLNNVPWAIQDAHITYTAAEHSIGINHFSLQSDDQAIEAHGVASPRATDSLFVKLRNFDIGYLLTTLGIMPISASGRLTGWCTAYSLLSEPMFEAHVDLPDAHLNRVSIGHLVADAHLNRENNTMSITANASDSVRRMIHLEGLVIPKEAWWGLDIDCDSVDIGMVDYWTYHILGKPSGRAYGKVKVFGKELKTWVTASLYAKDASVTVPVIGATFMFSDSVFLDSCAIRFPDMAIRDMEGHTGTFGGVIHHDQFLHMQFDLHAHLNNLLALNLPKSDQSSFYGKVYATGDASISGDESNTAIAVNARTEAKSSFTLSVATASSAVNTSNFIDFVAPDTAHTALLELLNATAPLTAPKVRQRAGTMRLSLMVDVTPTTEIQLKMGGDDGIKGYGEGSMRLEYDDRSGDVGMLGTYTLRRGQFTFTLGNLVRRQFEIADGSQIIWDGNLESPTLDVTAKYHLTASLRDLFGSEASSISTNRTSVPVNCVLHLTDRLFNPIINFAIELPQSDESVQSQVRSVISTNEMLMREVIYLLVFNCFYTPEYLQTSGQQGLNETYSLVSSTITGQINSWLSKLTDIFTMSFAFRRDGEGAAASQEYEANFSIRPIGRLIINGNFGYRYNDVSNRPFFGDLDVEYMLTDDGKFRAKAYTHTVDKYSLKQANTVQGVGFIYRYDFNWGDHKKKREAKQ